jgi:uncharacterized cupredoxin-like copper-binding protein
MRVKTITAALVGAALAAAVPATAATAHHAAKATTITVAMSEFKFKLSKTSAPAGTVTFKVTNKGKVPHDFKVGAKKTPLVGPGKSATLKVTFAKAGKFAYLCTVPGHAASGMKGTFTVKA